jgi:hypothetical protein
LAAPPIVNRRTAAALGLLLPCLPASFACQGPGRDPEATRVVPTSGADATQAISDPSRGFRLGWPGPGWKLLGEADARQLHPDAAAGAMSDSGTAAVVIVRPATPVALASYADALLASMPLDEKKAARNDGSTLGSHEARRFGVTGKVDGVELRYAGLVAGTDGALIRLIAWQSTATPCLDDRCFEPLWAAFSLLDGASPPPPTAPAAPATARGVGWRLRDGVFESSVSGLRVRPPSGWTLLVGSSLGRVDAEAEVGLALPEAGLTLLLGSEPIAPPPPPGSAAPRPWSYGAALPPPPPACRPPMPAPVEGEPVVVPGELAGHRLELRGGRTGQTDALGTAVPQDERCVQLRASYLSAARERARPLLAAGLGAVSVLSAAERRALGDELGQAGDPQNAVGLDFALRAGTYRNFRWHITWSKPEGPWRMSAEPWSRGLGKNALLEVEQRALGLHALLWAEPVGSGDASAYHQRAAELHGGRLDLGLRHVASTTIEGAEARVSEIDASEAGRPARYRLVTTVRDGTGLQLLIWGPTAVMTAHAEEVGAIVDGLHVRPTLTTVEPRAEVYRDHRLGFELSPPSTWTFADVTPPELAPLGSFVRWEHDGRWVGVVAACLPDGLQDTDWFVGLLEQLLREALGPMARGAATRNQIRLAGRDANHLLWQAALQRVDAAVAGQDNTVIALVTVDRSEESFEKAAPGLVLLP